MSQVLYPTLTIIGCGLIGSSLARAARASGVVERIVVAEPNAAARERILALGLADEVTGDAREGAREADLVIFATPPLSIGPAAARVADVLKPGATISDVGSVKAAICEAFAQCLPDTVFAIPGHPIAGTEKSGPDAGYAELFQDRWTILTPRIQSGAAFAAALERLTAFWQALGAKVEIME